MNEVKDTIEIPLEQYVDWLQKITIFNSMVKILQADNFNSYEDQITACLTLIGDN